MAALDADFAAVFEEVARYAASQGVRVEIFSGWRSRKRQTEIFRKFGRPRAAPPGRSFHEYGFAADIKTHPPGLESFIGQIAEAYGLRWGGRFKGRGREPWHIDAGSQITIQQARQFYGRGDYLVEVS